jgi:OmpA family
MEHKQKIFFKQDKLSSPKTIPITLNDTYTFTVFRDDKKQLIVLDYEDKLFRTESAVVLPECEIPASGGQAARKVSPIGLTTRILTYSYDHNSSVASASEAHKLFITGHTDTVGKLTYNQELSQNRAKTVLSLLTGDSNTFATICHQLSKWMRIADYQQILTWLSETRGWDCNPGPINDKDNGSTQNAVNKFKNLYNTVGPGASWAPPIKPEYGDPNTKETWVGYFNCYQEFIAKELNTTVAGLEQYRKTLYFADPNQWAGCNEYHPRTAAGLNEFECQDNRRVEVLIFEPGEEPDSIACCPDRAACNKDQCILYDPDAYQKKPFPGTTPPIPGLLGNITGFRLPSRYSLEKTFPKPSSLALLKNAAEQLASKPSSKMVIMGHTDIPGDESTNYTLSLSRARSVEALLMGNTAFFLERFKNADPIQKWGWEEIQWMLSELQFENEPLYMGCIDGHYGVELCRAIGNFQFQHDLPITSLCDDTTLETIIKEYCALIGDKHPVKSQLSVLGGGFWHPPRQWGLTGAPLLFPNTQSDDYEPDFRRVEMFYFEDGTINPPVSGCSSTLHPACVPYLAWCELVKEELDDQNALRKACVRFMDEFGIPYQNLSVTVTKKPDEITDTSTDEVIGTFKTSKYGAFVFSGDIGIYNLQVTVNGNEHGFVHIVDRDVFSGALITLPYQLLPLNGKYNPSEDYLAGSTESITP